MAAQSQRDMASLFTLYVHMRQRGHSMDSVVKDLQDDAYRLSREERHQLGELVSEWEQKYGDQPSAAPRPQPPAPAPAPVPSQPIKPPPEARPKPNPAFGTRFLDPSKLPGIPPGAAPASRPIEQLKGCPHCGKANSVNSKICQYCGQLMQAPVIATRRLESIGELAPHAAPEDPAYFGPTSTLLMAVRGAKGVLEAYPREKLVIGRSSAQTPGPVNIDFAPFGAEALGVSRIHAQLRCQNNTLAIIDLNSDNGTYVNDQRVFPHEVRVLRSGDEIRLGRLVFKIGYKHP